MKQLMIKSILFLMLIITPLLYLNYRYKNTNYYLQLNGLGKFREITGGIEVLNLGNSHEYSGIIYKNNVNRKGYNLALDSQPFEYDYYILDYYSKFLAEGAVVIIPISYHDWYYNYEEIFMKDISVYNERYYSVLDKNHIMNYDIKKDILYNRMPILTAGKNMKYIFEDTDWITNIEDTRVVEDIDKEVNYKYTSLTTEVMVSETEKKVVMELRNKKFLKKIIDYCYSQGYQPVLVTLPMTEELTNMFSEEFQKEFQNNCEEILSEYPELQYFNYLNEGEFSKNLQYFRDSDHLNTKGANAFSRRFFSDLEKAGIL